MNFKKNEEFVLKSGEIPQVIIQKKYDGIVLIAFRSGDKIKIFTDSGNLVEDSLPDLVEELKKKQPTDQFCWIGELEYWVKDKHQPRELMAALIHKKEKVTGKDITYNVFDCLFFDKDVHNLSQRKRQEILEKFNFPQNTMGVPREDVILNLAPSLYCETLKEAEKALQKCLKAKGSEGAMIKLLDTKNSGYSLSGISSAVFKQKTFASVHALVGKVNTTKIKDIFNYELYLRFRSSDKVDPKTIVEIQGKEYSHVGKSYNTKIKADVGTILTVKFHTINSYHDDETGLNRLHLYEPSIVEKWVEQIAPDYFSTAIKIGQDSGLLIEKVLTKAMDLLFRVSADQMKNFSPDYRRGSDFDQGILKMDTVPDELRKGRFVWFAVDDEVENFDKMDQELEIIKMKGSDLKIRGTTLTGKKITDLEIGEGTYPRHSGRYRGVSIGRDKNGYFIFTHRARSKSYPSPQDIPDKVLSWIESTG